MINVSFVVLSAIREQVALQKMLCVIIATREATMQESANLMQIPTSRQARLLYKLLL